MKLEFLKQLTESAAGKLLKFGVIIYGADGGRLKYDDMGISVFDNEQAFQKEIVKKFNDASGKDYIDLDAAMDDEDYAEFCENYWIVDNFS